MQKYNFLHSEICDKFSGFYRSILLGCILVGLGACNLGKSTPSGSIDAETAALNRSQIEQFRKDIQVLTQSFNTMQKQVQQQQVLLEEIRQQIDEKLLPASQQLAQQNLKIRKQSAEFRRLQRNLRELRVVVDNLAKNGSPTTLKRADVQTVSLQDFDTIAKATRLYDQGQDF